MSVPPCPIATISSIPWWKFAVCGGYGTVVHDRIRGLHEKERRLAIGIAPHFARMRRVIAANTDDAPDREPPGFASNRDRRRRRRIEHVALRHQALLSRAA
jgi:hypothetical protein